MQQWQVVADCNINGNETCCPFYADGEQGLILSTTAALFCSSWNGFPQTRLGFLLPFFVLIRAYKATHPSKPHILLCKTDFVEDNVWMDQVESRDKELTTEKNAGGEEQVPGGGWILNLTLDAIEMDINLPEAPLVPAPGWKRHPNLYHWTHKDLNAFSSGWMWTFLSNIWLFQAVLHRVHTRRI